MTYRVWFRSGDKFWWKPIEAESEEKVLKKLTPTRRKQVSKIQPIGGS